MEKLNLKYWDAKVTNVIIFLLGVVMVLVSANLGMEKTISVVLTSVGASLIASAVVAWISSQYLIFQSQRISVVENWGLNCIYKTRAESNVSTNKILIKAEQLDICAMGLKGFRDAQSELVKQRIGAGMKLRILTINPTSDILSVIDETEENTTGTTRGTIETLEKWVHGLQQQQLYPGQVQLRTYNRYPHDYYFNVDGYVFVGPYQRKSSQQTITYEFDKYGEGAKYYRDYFEKLWENSDES